MPEAAADRTDAPGADFGDREQSLAESLRGSGRATRARRSVGEWSIAHRRSCRPHPHRCAEPLPNATRAGEYRDLYTNVASRFRQHTTERMPAPPCTRHAMGLDSYLSVSRFICGGRMVRPVAGREKWQDWLRSGARSILLGVHAD